MLRPLATLPVGSTPMMTYGELLAATRRRVGGDLAVWPAPPELEDWSTWAAEAADMPPVAPSTLSGHIIEQAGPAWAYGLSLRRGLAGDLPSGEPARTEARQVLRMFDGSVPLYIGQWASPECFTGFVPVLTQHRSGRFTVGLGRTVATFAARDSVHALDMARIWLAKQRAAEISARKAAARRIDAPTIGLDLLTARLVSQPTDPETSTAAVHDKSGTALVWRNVTHGRYGVQAPTWCHLFRSSARSAVRLGYLACVEAQRQGQDDVRWGVSAIVGRAANLLGFDGWRVTDAVDGYTWADNGAWSVRVSTRSTRHWRVCLAGDAVIGFELVRRSADGSVSSVKVQGRRRGPMSYRVPAWGLTDSDLVAWATSLAMRKEK